MVRVSVLGGERRGGGEVEVMGYGNFKEEEEEEERGAKKKWAEAAAIAIGL